MGKFKDLVFGERLIPDDTGMLEVKIKKLHPNAVIPRYGTSGAAGMDITAISMDKPELTKNGWILTYRTGLAIQPPPGYFIDLRPRSSIYKTCLQLVNSPGTGDEDFTGEYLFKFRDLSKGLGSIYQPGDRIGQIIVLPYPKVVFTEVDELIKTDRGEGGFGSTNEQNKEQKS